MTRLNEALREKLPAFFKKECRELKVDIRCNKKGKIVLIPLPGCDMGEDALEGKAKAMDRLLGGLSPTEIGIPLLDEGYDEAKEVVSVNARQQEYNNSIETEAENDTTANDVDKSEISSKGDDNAPAEEVSTEINKHGPSEDLKDDSIRQAEQDNQQKKQHLSKQVYEHRIQNAMKSDWELKIPEKCSICGNENPTRIVTNTTRIFALCEGCSI